MAKLLLRMPTFEESLTGQRPAALRALAGLLGSAALLRLDGEFELVEARFEPIAENRFAVPARVLTREELRASLNPPPR